VSHRRGVVCIFCSTRTPLPVPSDQNRNDAFADRHSWLTLVRCDWCGKEAQYMADEVVVMQAAAAGASKAGSFPASI
jgi:hypothetical protein